jgi:hypothetical protein
LDISLDRSSIDNESIEASISLGGAMTLNTSILAPTLAWVYVGLRVAHSLVQALVNVVIWRFLIFMAGSVVLLILAIRLAMVVL